MEQEILKLEEAARLIEPDSLARQSIRNETIAYSEEFLADIANRKAYETNDKAEKLLNLDFSEEPVEPSFVACCMLFKLRGFFSHAHHLEDDLRRWIEGEVSRLNHVDSFNMTR